jgi:serine/threonine-protein kinase RsbW
MEHGPPPGSRSAAAAARQGRVGVGLRTRRFAWNATPDTPALPRWLDAVETSARRMACQGGLDEDACHYLAVAVREALVNAVRHGRRTGEPAQVDVSLERRADGRLLVVVRDRGPGFDPRGVPDPLAPENIVRNGGRGIYLMRHFADRVVYSFPRGGGTLVRLEKRLPGREPG